MRQHQEQHEMTPPPNRLKEREDYQKLILEYLEKENGYTVRNAQNFNDKLAMDKELLLKFLEETQPEAIEKLKKLYKDDFEKQLLNDINTEINKDSRSLLHVLKNGVEFRNGVNLTLLYRKPATSFNPEQNKRWQNNILSVMEEVRHKDDERIDLVIFLNGFAIISIELKCNTSGQDYADAIKQYKDDRDPKTRLLKYKSGCLVNFAMDLNEVYMCTKLDGKASTFLPFNKGSEDKGKGNPHNPNGINVSYMWEDILTKETICDLIEKYIYFEITGTQKERKEFLIFPRYHQLDAIRKLTADITEKKKDSNYLIEHSAGSGKTKTIAWLSHRLASIHDKEDKNIFNSVIIMTDRVVVDRQLQDAVYAMEHKQGLVKALGEECTSKDLADALTGNTKIIVTTIQKFRFILDKVSALKQKTFAIIIDEAHSSTSGKNIQAVTQVLSEDEEDHFQSLQDEIVDEIDRTGNVANVSFIAFTATPVALTLDKFGTKNKKGNKESFHLYSMKQAIEEGFILNVLSNYVTYKTYYDLNKIIEDDPELKSRAAKKKIAKYIELDDTNISQKVEVIIEHFKNNVMQELGGNGKAMVTTSSRDAAVKYKLEFDKYIRENNYEGIKSLVAFSGTVKLDDVEYSEAGMNKFSEAKLPEEFDTNTYQVLLVANKYQTGFDQKKLVAMYVDKKMKGSSAVQTLSRLNRICPPYNKTTFVLDFKNKYEEIEKAFEPYFMETTLKEGVTPSDIRALEAKVDAFHILNIDDIEQFNILLYQEKLTPKIQATMWSLLDNSLKEILKKPEDEISIIKKTIRSFLRFYLFLIQVTCFEDVDLHKKYNYLTYVVKNIEISTSGNDFIISDKIIASNFTQKKMSETKVPDIVSHPELSYLKADLVSLDDDQKKKLSEIIDEMNAVYNLDIDPDVATKSILQIRDLLLKDDGLKQSAKSNTMGDFKFTFGKSVEDALVKGSTQNYDLFNALLNNPDVTKRMMSIFLEDIYKTLKKEEQINP